MIGRSYILFLAIILSVLPFGTTAQVLPITNQLLPVQNQTTDVAKAHILVEADTYVPSFYKGRSEPTPGNQMRLVAMNPARGDTYQWEIEGRHYTTTEPYLSITTPDVPRILVRLQILANKQVIARASEYINISSPRVVFYENNALRGLSRLAIGNPYTLVGEQADIHAEPYFIGSLQNSTARWSGGGLNITETESPLGLNIKAPENTNRTYRVDFTLQNTVRLSEKAQGTFTVNFGL